MSGDNDSNATTIEVLDSHCYLIRNILDIHEQAALFEDIRHKDEQSTKNQTAPKSSTRALYPSPRTVQLGVGRHPTKIKFGRDDPTLYSQLVDKANQSIRERELCNYRSITLSAIEYKANEHSLAEHVDHDDSFVYLLTIGCTTNFLVKGPNSTEKQLFPIESGDMVVFDASTTGNILHGIESIENNTCPQELVDRFPILQNHRYGIQLRVRF